MSNKIFGQAIELSLCIMQDIYGNVISGQSPERILGYLEASRNLLSALQKAEGNRNTRHIKEIKKAVDNVTVILEKLPPFDTSAASLALATNYKLIQAGVLQDMN